MRPEIMHRASDHAGALGPLKKAVLSSRELDAADEKVFADSLAATKLWYNAGTWPRLADSQLDVLDREIVKRTAYVHDGLW